MKRQFKFLYLLPILLALFFSHNVFASEQDSDSAMDGSDFVVTLLGTGNPAPLITRFSMSTLVKAGDVYLLFDAGRGVTMRLFQSGLSRGQIDAIFLTHLHSDHITGLPDLYLTSWITDNLSPQGVIRPFVIYGPAAIKNRSGTKSLMHGIKKAFAADIYIRKHDEGYSTVPLKLKVHEIDETGVIFEKDGVKVIAFPVNHGPGIEPAYGYKVVYDGRSVVISGDTKYEPNGALIKMAKEADVIIHEVAAVGPLYRNTPVTEAIAAHHTTPEQAGKVFSATKPRLAVYSHIVTPAKKLNNRPSAEEIVERTRKTYKGALLVGSDLDQIFIGKEKITVHPPVMGLLPVHPFQMGPVRNPG